MTQPAEEISSKLMTLFQAVAGLTSVRDHYPETVDEPPLLYILPGAVKSDRAGQVRTRTYTFDAVLLLKFQDWEQSESEVRGWVDPLLDALEADPTLGGYLGPLGGRAVIEMADPDFEDVGKVVFRSLPFTIIATRKSAA